MRVAGLFAGIGGIERGLERAGLVSRILCEIDPSARAVLGSRFPDVELVGDIRDLDVLPLVELVAAGFPCQDLSQAGQTAGIRGEKSGLINEVFRLLDEGAAPRWLLLENVPFMLQLDSGRGMRFLVDELERREFAWAYRTVDARAFGLPQRRRRVIVVASREADPRDVLLADDAGAPAERAIQGSACGFYWTEGIRGLGWAVDAVPTLKGGSTVGIPSPPAILLSGGRLITPDIRDAERLQGFPSDWTKPASSVSPRAGVRWKLVGNAVSVPVAAWVGSRLLDPGSYDPWADELLSDQDRWPEAAWGGQGKTYRSQVSAFPVRRRYKSLETFLRYEGKPLSARATAGFLRRANSGKLRFPPGFLDSVRQHLERLSN